MKLLLKDGRGIATILVVVLVVLGVVVVGTVVTGAVLLSNDMEITVNNQSGSTLDIAKGSAALRLNFLPGINVPSEIKPGDTAVVQIPKRFIDSVTISTSNVELRAFSHTYIFGTSGINMQRSTWDGTALAGLVGQKIEISGKHTLVIAGN